MERQFKAKHVTSMTTARVAGAVCLQFLKIAHLTTRKMAASSSSSSKSSNELVDCRRLGQAGSGSCQRLQSDAECPDSVLDNCSIRVSEVCLVCHESIAHSDGKLAIGKCTLSTQPYLHVIQSINPVCYLHLLFAYQLSI